jgi:hypothetical protein
LSFVFTYLCQPLKRFTFQAPKTRAWVESRCMSKVVLNLFAGPTRLHGCTEISNDINPEFGTTYQMDALDCVQLLISRGVKVDVVVNDRPIVCVRVWSSIMVTVIVALSNL